MVKKKLVIAMGKNCEEMLSKMRERNIPFLRMIYAPVHDRKRKEWSADDFTMKVSDIMCPRKDGEESYVVVTGIHSTDEFQDFLSKLTNRTEYQILAFTLAQVRVSEVVTLLEKFLYGVYFEIPGVILYRADTAQKEELQMAS